MRRNRTVEVRYVRGDGPWRIYWSGTQELADDRRFATLEEVGPVARALLELPTDEIVDALVRCASSPAA